MGHKEREGDEKTPEGSYIIDYRNPESRFYLSLHISYPREEDEERAQRKGVMPGGNVFIHGNSPHWVWLEHRQALFESE